MREPSSIILALALDAESQQRFTFLRNQYYPGYCNYLEAHLTLFHKLPTGDDFIQKTLQTISQRPAIDLKITSVKNTGKGVAFEIASEELMQLHKTLQFSFSSFLIKKDRQELWPHITVQNKVTAYKAAQTFKALQQDFEPFTAKATGIASWLYMGGPWQKQNEYPFMQ